MSRSVWSRFDEWDRETDPALLRMRTALALNAPEPVDAAPGPETALPEPSKRARVAQLVARIRAGDLTAVETLRRLIG